MEKLKQILMTLRHKGQEKIDINVVLSLIETLSETKKDYVINLYKHNERFNKSKVAKELNITRQSIHNYINDYKKTKKT